MKIRQELFVLAAAAFFAAAPGWADIKDSVDIKTTEFDLSNGLHVILKEDHTLPLITTDVMYKVGSAAETKGHTGFAHLFEHLMFCGSAHVGKGQFEELVHSVCGDCNASTHEDYTNYHITVPSNSLPMALFLESDRMGYFIDNMRLGIVDEQRDVVKNEHRQKHHKAADEILSALYPDGHPYSRSVMGSMDDLTAAEYADVVNFFKEHYSPSNASLTVVGDFDSAEAKTQVEYWFSDIPKRHVCNKIHSTASPEFSSIVKKTVYVPDDKPHRTLYWHTPAIAQEGDDALHILSNLFNLNSARIQQRVTRNKRMVSEIVVCQDSKELGSVFAIEFYPLPGYSMDEIQKIVDEEIERIAVEPPSQQEVDMAVAALEFQSVVHSGRLENYAEELNHSYLFRGKAIEPAAALERYRRLTPEDISACAKRYLCPGKRLEITVLPEPVPAGHNAVRH